MTKIRDYNMNRTSILGVDAGYGNYKAARCCFPTSVSRSDQPPVYTRNYLEYDGGYYIIGEGHKDFVAEKSMDGDNYVLTLAAIAKELYARDLNSAKIHLAVGLPLKWVQAQRDSFREYMLQNRHVEYKYAGRRYVVDIVDCTVMPQCYAAIAESLPDFKGMHMVADIGNGTMNMMILNNGKASESRSWTVKLGANECFRAIRNLILDREAEELPAEIIENYLRYGDAKVSGEYQKLMEEAAKSYVDKIYAELKAHGYNPNLMKLYVMGGGAKIVETVGDYDPDNVTFNHDIRADAKGYEYFCYMKLRRQKAMASAGGSF